VPASNYADSRSLADLNCSSAREFQVTSVEVESLRLAGFDYGEITIDYALAQSESRSVQTLLGLAEQMKVVLRLIGTEQLPTDGRPHHFLRHSRHLHHCRCHRPRCSPHFHSQWP
jgi:hypothetical protein